MATDRHRLETDTLLNSGKPTHDRPEMERSWISGLSGLLMVVAVIPVEVDLRIKSGRGTSLLRSGGDILKHIQ